MELTADNVNRVFRDCFFREEEDKTDYVQAEGILHTVGFHPKRLESHRQNVTDMLSMLPTKFKTTGESFLNACDRADGVQWTGLHRTMEQLFLLGIALGLVESQAPRDMWSALPGGMPYYIVKVV